MLAKIIILFKTIFYIRFIMGSDQDNQL